MTFVLLCRRKMVTDRLTPARGYAMEVVVASGDIARTAGIGITDECVFGKSIQEPEA